MTRWAKKRERENRATVKVNCPFIWTDKLLSELSVEDSDAIPSP